jgi:hypothetical protein
MLVPLIQLLLCMQVFFTPTQGSIPKYLADTTTADNDDTLQIWAVFINKYQNKAHGYSMLR